MKGKSNDYCFIEPMIIDILEKSEMPIQPLCISFKINEMSGKIVNLNVVKSHLDELVTRRKVIKKINKDEMVFYSLKK